MIDERLDPHPRPKRRPFCDINLLVDLDLGDRKTLLRVVHAKEIPSTRIGRKILIPTAWVVRELDPDAA